MTSAEKIELALIPLAGLVLCVAGRELPGSIRCGRLLLVISAALLTQGLIRDLFLLAAARRAPRGEQRHARCMCVESTVGVGGLAIGGLAAGLGIGVALPMAPWAWGVLTLAAGLVGFVMKDFVVEWHPWRIRREPDHVNILVEWKW